MLIYIGSFALHPAGKTEPFDDLKCEMGTPDFETFLKRVRTRWPLILDASDTAKARQTLFDLVDRSIERLEAKVEVYRSLAAAAAASGTDGPAGNGSMEADRLKRYEHASDRRAKRCLDAFYKFRREMGGEDEDEGLIAEDGGEWVQAANAADSNPESGVAAVEPCSENRDFTSEANGATSTSEAAEMKEVAACNEELRRGLAELARLREQGIGVSGMRAGGDRKGRAAIEEAIAKRGPLLPPIS